MVNPELKSEFWFKTTFLLNLEIIIEEIMESLLFQDRMHMYAMMAVITVVIVLVFHISRGYYIRKQPIMNERIGFQNMSTNNDNTNDDTFSRIHNYPSLLDEPTNNYESESKSDTDMKEDTPEINRNQIPVNRPKINGLIKVGQMNSKPNKNNAIQTIRRTGERSILPVVSKRDKYLSEEDQIEGKLKENDHVWSPEGSANQYIPVDINYKPKPRKKLTPKTPNIPENDSPLTIAVGIIKQVDREMEEQDHKAQKSPDGNISDDDCDVLGFSYLYVILVFLYLTSSRLCDILIYFLIVMKRKQWLHLMINEEH